MQRKLTEENAKRLGKAADIIARSFSWSDTNEGREYWWDVYEHLRNKAANRTSDGNPCIVPIDQPLTDEDACVWPQLLVMVRDADGDDWQGPFFLLSGNDSSWPFGVACKSNLWRGGWKRARLATTEEIEAANGNS